MDLDICRGDHLGGFLLLLPRQGMTDQSSSELHMAQLQRAG
jgi:hypothetical protein